MTTPTVMDNPAAGGGGPANDIYAATRVVDPAGAGTDTTIAAAIANLPAQGGSIYIKPDTYSLAATLTLPDKDVEIYGSGDGTILDLGSNAIAAFTVPDGLTALRRYVFKSLKIVGDETAGQTGVSIQDANSYGYVTIKEVDTDGIQYPIEVTASDSDVLTPVQVEAEDCFFIPNSDGASVLVQTPDDDFNFLYVILRRVNFYRNNDIYDTVGGMLGSQAGDLVVWVEDSNISLTNDFYVGTIIASGSSFMNWSAGFPQIFFFGDPADLYGGSFFTNCYFQSLEFTPYEKFNVKGGYISDCYFYFSGNGEVSFKDCLFEMGSNATIGIESSGADLCTISGVHFEDNADTAQYYIYSSTQGTFIDNCRFGPLGTAGVSHIRITGGQNTVRGCMFNDSSYPPVIDDAGATRYSDNMFYDAAHYPTVNYYGTYYAMMGANGVGHFQILAQTETGVFANFLKATSICGVLGVGTFKNVGGDSLEIKEIATDYWGTTDSATNTVTAGNERALSTLISIGAARVPYKNYTVQVRHLGVASNFDLSFSGSGMETPTAL